MTFASPLDPILRPRSIAVVGASRTPGTIAHELVASLVRCGFVGPVFPINPNASSVCAIKAYPTIRAVPDPVDQAVIVVPKERVESVVRECADHGVKGLVVISAGFREIGGEGVERERRLTAFVRERGIRMVGPNCMGVLNADPAVSMNGTFYPNLPPFGRAGFVSQSGAMGLSVLDYAREYGIGIAQFVSVGNKPDVSGNDLLEAWEHDPGIDSILMYVESFGNPRRFLEIASRITRKKPIIVVKSGRSRAGARAASSHTGALAASDTAVDAMLTQAGVLRAGSVGELFDLAMAFSGQPLPRSRRTAVLTNAGGPGILAADALERHEVDIPELSPPTVERLRPLFPEYASIRNPLDMIASATPPGYRTALAALLEDPAVDSAVAIFVPPLGVSQGDVSEAIAAAAITRPDKPVLAVLMGHEGLPAGKAGLHEAGIPAYIFPESAARALAAMCRQREWSEKAVPVVETLPVDRPAAERIIAEAVAAGTRKLPEAAALDLLAAYGVPVARARLARTPEESAIIAAEFGGLVALKIVAPAIIHKSDVGGVVLGLSGPAVAEGHRRMIATVTERVPGAEITGVLVQEMLPSGREMIVGGTRDASFGPMVMFGLGGVFVEVLSDVVFRMAPIARSQAGEMITGLRGAKLLAGVRGQPPADRRAIEDVLLRVSQLLVDFPIVAELDLNPLLVYPDRAVAADARVVLGLPEEAR
ncbi:MAG: acetate--CoA ligase family protein [Gemmatimonadetes bacterium]|nr:acetate--CoA ligase family protein [Gemmatimonadota bacterium]